MPNRGNATDRKASSLTHKFCIGLLDRLTDERGQYALMNPVRTTGDNEERLMCDACSEDQGFHNLRDATSNRGGSFFRGSRRGCQLHNLGRESPALQNILNALSAGP